MASEWRNALVTGASGLIGANLVRALVAKGYGVRALIRPTSDRSVLDGLPVTVAVGDVLDAESLAPTLDGVDIVFHAASFFAYWGHPPDEVEETAVRGTVTVLRAARGAGVRRIVLTSSSVVLGYSDQAIPISEDHELADENDEPYYVRSKIRQDLAAHAAARDLGVELVTVCPTMSVGPHGTTLGPSNAVITTFLSDPFRSTYPGGCNIVSVRDVARGHVLVAEAGVPGRRYVLGSENLEWRDIHRTIAELSGVTGPLVSAPRAMSYLAATAEEIRARLLCRPPLTTREQARMVGRYYWYSHAQAAALGYAPRPARAALAEAIGWLTTSRHISRQIRASLNLSREVYAARRALARDEALVRVPS